MFPFRRNWKTKPNSLRLAKQTPPSPDWLQRELQAPAVREIRRARHSGGCGQRQSQSMLGRVVFPSLSRYLFEAFLQDFRDKLPAVLFNVVSSVGQCSQCCMCYNLRYLIPHWPSFKKW